MGGHRLCVAAVFALFLVGSSAQAEGDKLVTGVAASPRPEGTQAPEAWLQQALDLVEQVDTSLWDTVDSFMGVLLSSPTAGSGSAEPGRGRRLQAAVTPDDLVAQVKSLSQKLLKMELKESMVSTANAVKSAVGIPSTSTTEATATASKATADAAAALLLQSIQDALVQPSSSGGLQQVPSFPMGPTSRSSGAASGASALASNAKMFTNALNVLVGVNNALYAGASAAPKVPSSATGSGSSGVTAPAETVQPSPSPSADSTQSSGSTSSRSAPEAAPSATASVPTTSSAASSTAPPTAGGDSSTGVAPLGDIFSQLLRLPTASTPADTAKAASDFMARLPSMPNLAQLPNLSQLSNLAHLPSLGQLPNLPQIQNLAKLTQLSPEGVASGLQTMFNPASMQSSASGWGQQVQDVMGALQKHQGDLSILFASMNAPAASSSSRRRLLELTTATDVPARFRALREHWDRVAHPLLVSTRRKLQALPSQQQTALAQQVPANQTADAQRIMAQGVSAVTAGWKMGDDLLSLLHDTVRLTVAGAQAATSGAKAAAGVVGSAGAVGVLGQSYPQATASAFQAAGLAPAAPDAEEGDAEDWLVWDDWAKQMAPEAWKSDEAPGMDLARSWDLVWARRRLQSQQDGAAAGAQDTSYEDYSDEYTDEELLDEYGWMLEEQDDDDVASLVVGLVASSSSSTGSMPQPVLDWLLQQGVKTDGPPSVELLVVNLLLHLLGADSGQLSPEQLQYILAASTSDSASAAASAGTGEAGLPHFVVFGPKGGRTSGNQSSNASADAAPTPSTRSTIAELVVVPLSGTARPPASHRSDRDDTLSANLKWWGVTISLAFVGMLLGAVAVAVVKRSSTSRLDSDDSYNHIPGVPQPPAPPAKAPAAWEKAVQSKAAQQEQLRGTVAKKLSNLPA